ncbi:MAG: AHH domain-containing protein [Flavobacteriales bacterium]|nr:AHH domain-containing protein [Flavobacteriales bacterium]MCB9448614.1 AHH domain-containing protein [Flavobacteriales bacterium]
MSNLAPAIDPNLTTSRHPGRDEDRDTTSAGPEVSTAPRQTTDVNPNAMSPLSRQGQPLMAPRTDSRQVTLTPNRPSGIDMRTTDRDPNEETTDQDTAPETIHSREMGGAAGDDGDNRSNQPGEVTASVPDTPPVHTNQSTAPAMAGAGQNIASGPTQSPEKTPSPKDAVGNAASGAQGGGPLAPGAGGPSGEGGGKAPESVPDQPLDTGDSSSMIASITSMDAVSFANNMQKASAAAQRLQGEEKKAQQDGLPEIEQPTGVPTKKQKQQAETQLKKDQAPELNPEGNADGKKIETTHENPSGPVPGSHAPHFSEPTASQNEDEGSWWSRLINRIKSYLRSLPEGDSGVSTSAGDRPKVDLSGQADPSQNETHQRTAEKKVDDNQADADMETTKDFGEKDVYPDMETETMRPKTEIMGLEPREGKELGKRDITADVRTSLNANMQSRMDEAVAPKKDEFQQAKDTYETDSAKEKEDGLAKIDEETARVKSEQEGHQAGAAKQVEEERSGWKKENEEIKKRYDKQSTEKKKEIDGKIDKEVKTSEQETDKKLNEAETQAKQEKKKAEDEAKRKKREAENRPRSFWDRVKGAISDFFDKIRSAINAIFDGLRKLVKGIIELAKKVVKGIIELARRAIVGLIKAFGEALKALVSIALAAFPELAKKVRAAIDRAVNKAVDAVNKAAQALKDFADKVLDAIGKALDFILSVYQKFYNAIIDALEFIAVGIIEIIEGIANLVAAARKMPDHFWGEVSKELLGQDVTKPLPGLERTSPPQVPGASPGSATASQADPANAALLSKSTLSPEDVVIDPVPEIDLDPELLAMVLASGGGEVPFGNEEPGDLTMEEIRAMTGGGMPEGGMSPIAPGGTASGGAGGGPDFMSMTDDQKMEYYLSQMSPQCNDMKGEAPKGDSDNSIPDVAKVGPLTVAQRGGFILSQVKKGIANWWECNKVMIIGIMVAALLGLAVAAFFTGGAAILAALQAMMTALTVIFGAILVAKMGYHMGLYMKKAWTGDIEGGAQSLARAIAVGLVELVFNFLFKVGGLLLKIVKRIAKAIVKLAKGAGKLAMKGAKLAWQGLKVVGKTAFKVTRRLAAPIIRGGKVFMKGVGKWIGKGVKKLKDLGKRLKNHFGFKGFSLEIHGSRFYLYGYFNPKKLLATGNVGDISKREARRLRKLGSNEELVGKTINTGGKKAIVISEDFARKLESMTPAQRAAEFKRLEGMTADQIRKLGGGTSKTYQLRKGIPGAKPKNFEAHHILPEELLNNPHIKGFLNKIGFNVNDGAVNGVMLPPSNAARFGRWGRATVHKGYHKAYSDMMEKMVQRQILAYEQALKSGVAEQVARDAARKALIGNLKAIRKALMKGKLRLTPP